MNITIEQHDGFYVLRDDLLVGGTKSILMSSIDNPNITEFVYATPVYGGFQIALSAYCQSVGKKTTLFCAERKKKHPNTLQCLKYNANVVEVPYGYLSVIEKKARDYCQGKEHTQKIIFGANSLENKKLIANRMTEILKLITIDEVWCVIGSGTLISGILMAVPQEVKVFGVQVGKEITNLEMYSNLSVLKYPKSFDKDSKIQIGFPSTSNYDRKAYELLLQHRKNTNKKILFWNVL